MPDDSIRFRVDHHLHTDSLHNEGGQNLETEREEGGKYDSLLSQDER